MANEAVSSTPLHLRLQMAKHSRYPPSRSSCKSAQLHIHGGRVMQIDHRAFPPQIKGPISELLRANRWATLGISSLPSTLNCFGDWSWASLHSVPLIGNTPGQVSLPLWPYSETDIGGSNRSTEFLATRQLALAVWSPLPHFSIPSCMLYVRTGLIDAAPHRRWWRGWGVIGLIFHDSTETPHSLFNHSRRLEGHAHHLPPSSHRCTPTRCIRYRRRWAIPPPHIVVAGQSTL